MITMNAHTMRLVSEKIYQQTNTDRGEENKIRNHESDRHNKRVNNVPAGIRSKLQSLPILKLLFRWMMKLFINTQIEAISV